MSDVGKTSNYADLLDNEDKEKMKAPEISIVIPCRNEENYVGKCLDSIIENNYTKDELEIFVVDGMSEDNTRDAVKIYSEKYPFIKLLDNYKKITPSAFNIGIKASQGKYIIILSSHSKVAHDFIKKNIESLSVRDTDCAGGIIITLPADQTLIAQSIASAVSHSFGVGNVYFRIGSKKPRYVDTVPFGCYKREVFDKFGLFDEELVRNQDDEFNLRIIKNGGKILLVPEIVSYYYARDSLSKVFKMYFQYGYFKPLVALKIGAVLTYRQLIPAFFVGSLFISFVLSFIFKPFFFLLISILSLYVIANLGFSLQIAIKKELKLLFALPIVFFTLHFSYGTGYLKGIIDFVLFKKHLKKKIRDVPLTR